ncbi:minichromosome maintenance protein MCM [Candidatus Woesearchaeota archaeon]|nr:minichromosome maintenance protein MCM [Candidatus Woesearchaeota archaeon]
MDASTQIELFQDFIDSHNKAELLDAARKNDQSLRIDFSELSKFNIELAELLLNKPDDVIKAAELAISKFDIDKKIKVRFCNLPKSSLLYVRNIRSEHIGRFIKTIGVIRQKTDVRPQVVGAKFECPSCGNIINVNQDDNTFKQPTKCGCGRKGKFRLIEKKLIDAQKLVIEEAHELLEGGAQPKRINVYLHEDLTSPWTDKRTNPGTKVMVTGAIKELPIITRSGSQSVLFDLALIGNYIEPIEEDFTELSIGEKELKEIIELSKDPKIYEKLKLSIAPSIFGHEKVKEALVMQLFGGVRKVRDDGVITRGDMHILLIGDPGSGKSQLIKRMSVVAPKARFVSGKGVSGAGLTATVVKDEFTQGWALEAGALVLANRGYCMIDELDKMNKEDRDAMHEGLEQQSISISKANIQATLRCETTVLSAANPKFGRFDPYMSIPEQIELPVSLINRFDLIFAVKDLPDKEKDRTMSRFILKLHQNIKNEMDVPIRTEVIRKYVAYAKQTCFPVLTDDALQEIEDYYVKMRSSGADEGSKSVPISARQLEGILRLAEASARVRLAKEVSVEDAQRAIVLMQFWLSELAMDKETGKIDIDKIASGISTSERQKIVGVREIIIELENKLGKVIPTEDIVKEAEAKGINATKVEESIEKLKRSGDIFEPKPGFISRL